MTLVSKKKNLLARRLEGALAAVADRGRGGASRSHRRVRSGLDPVAVHLDVLRLRLHTATASPDAAEAEGMAEAAAMCDDARGHLDAMRQLIDDAGAAARLGRPS